MTTRIIIVRHGNTFLPGVTPTRIGSKTDLDLVETKKGVSIGNYLNIYGISLSALYSGPLRRHYQTAEIVCNVIGFCRHRINIDNIFDEIDHGEDENKNEIEVLTRLGHGDIEKGKEILDLWNKNGIVPNGWHVNTEKLINNWHEFADRVLCEYKNNTVMVVSSAGTIRFSRVLDQKFYPKNLKIPTGAMCIFERNQNVWTCVGWGILP